MTYLLFVETVLCPALRKPGGPAREARTRRFATRTLTGCAFVGAATRELEFTNQ